jgi:prepilin-type N-terminal cleavage/methylation domain-containing protein
MRGERGFSLLEVLVALALIAVVLLLASGFYWQQVRTDQRLARQRQADAALLATYELLRAGALPLADGELPDPTDSEIALTASLTPSETPGLTEIELAATFEIQGGTFRRTLDALLYAP